MTPLINNDELLVLFSLISTKHPKASKVLSRDKVSLDSLVAKGLAVKNKDHSTYSPTQDGRWKYMTMCSIESSHLHRTPECVVNLMIQKGLW